MRLAAMAEKRSALLKLALILVEEMREAGELDKALAIVEAEKARRAAAEPQAAAG
jgi:hypothetical protein